MQINKINTTNNFGAMPDKMTKKLLENLATNGIDISNIARTMKEIYANKLISTKISADGYIRMGLYNLEEGRSKLGTRYATLTNELISSNDKLSIKTPEKLAKKLLDVLNWHKNSRTHAQKTSDTLDNLFGKI